MEQKSSNFISSTPQVHKGIVLAVHDTSTKPTRLSAILAPKNDQDTLEKKYGFKSSLVMSKKYIFVFLSESKTVNIYLYQMTL